MDITTYVTYAMVNTVGAILAIGLFMVSYLNQRRF